MADSWNSPDKFNREASQWDENPQRKAVALAVAHAIIAETKPDKTMLALEFGCGTGLVTMEMAPLVKRLLALDTSMGMLSILKEKIERSGTANIETSCADLSLSSEAIVTDNAIDLIYGSMTLHHIDDTARFIIQTTKLLSSGGIIAIADLDLEDGLFHDNPLEKVHHGFDREELAANMNAAGLKVISFKTIYSFEKTNRSYPVFLVTAVKETS